MTSKIIGYLFIIVIALIIFLNPTVPNFSIEDEYRTDNQETQIIIVHDKSDEYRIIHYYNGQELVGSIIAKNNTLIADKNKLQKIFYAENVANFVKNEDLEGKYKQTFDNLEILEQKSKKTHDLIVSTSIKSLISVLGATSQLSIVTFSTTIFKERIKKSITIKDVLEYIENLSERSYNFNTAKNDLQTATSISNNLKNFIELDNTYLLQIQNEKITNDLKIVNQDINFKITEKTYTTIGQLSIDLGNYLISNIENKSIRVPKYSSIPIISEIENIYITADNFSRNTFLETGSKLLEYGQSWQLDFENYEKNYNYINNLNSEFIILSEYALNQTDNSLKFVNQRKLISKNKIIDMEIKKETVSSISIIKSIDKWIEIYFYLLSAKYIHENEPLTIEYLCNEINKNIESMKNT